MTVRVQVIHYLPKQNVLVPKKNKAAMRSNYAQFTLKNFEKT